eukprot:2351876-Rhodomonas_salina.2
MPVTECVQLLVVAVLGTWKSIQIRGWSPIQSKRVTHGVTTQAFWRGALGIPSDPGSRGTRVLLVLAVVVVPGYPRVIVRADLRSSGFRFLAYMCRATRASGFLLARRVPAGRLE